jgi:diacylglycerol kinase
MNRRKQFINSLGHAIDGFRYLYQTQNNVRIHFVITIGIIFLSIVLSISIIEWGLIILTMALVWITESFNTVYERLFDLADPTVNPLVKIGKDVSAAAVLISAVVSIIVGILVFLPRLLVILFTYV